MIIINDILRGRTWIFDYDGQTVCFKISVKKYLEQFQSISVKENYFYMRYPELKDIEIFDIFSWGNF